MTFLRRVDVSAASFRRHVFAGSPGIGDQAVVYFLIDFDHKMKYFFPVVERLLTILMDEDMGVSGLMTYTVWGLKVLLNTATLVGGVIMIVLIMKMSVLCVRIPL